MSGRPNNLDERLVLSRIRLRPLSPPMSEDPAPDPLEDPSPQDDDLAWAQASLGAGPELAGGWFEVGHALDQAVPLPETDGSEEGLRALLHGDSPRLILERLYRGDPLNLAHRVPEVLAEVAMILDPSRVVWRAMAQVAHRAVLYGYRGERLATWLRARILEAIESLLEEDWAEERQRLPIDPLDDRYSSITKASSLAPHQARRLALTFNRLPDTDRRPLYEALYLNEPMERVAERHDLELAELQGRIQAVLLMFTHDPEVGGTS